MKRADQKKLAWEAYYAGNLNGGDPFEHGVVPKDIARGIRLAFESWWQVHRKVHGL